MQKKVDQEILSLYRNGRHQDALKIMLSEYQERIYWQIRRIVLTHEDTDDVLQNVIIKVWKGLEKFNDKSQLYTWIFRIANNETYTFLEKNKHHRKTIDLPEQFEFKATSAIDDPSTADIEQKLEMALATLPEKQRMVFHLKYFEDLKYKEITDITGTSIGALKANYHLAVKKIEEFIKTN